MKKRFIQLSALAIVAVLMASCTQADGKTTAKSPLNATEPSTLEFRDFGNEPFVFNIEDYTKENETYRTALWTGENMQLTVMSLLPGEDIGLEMHSEHDQFIRVEEGEGIVMMGDTEDNLSFQGKHSVNHVPQVSFSTLSLPQKRYVESERI